MNVRDKFLALQAEMNSFLKERNDEVLGLVLALLSRQHVLLFGPRGTAKSLMIRMLNGQVRGAVYWERLFTRFTVPEEVFGPVKVSALKNDSFERQTHGHLPEAVFAFIDEIFKANSSILNSLLTVINERLYHNDGAPTQVPLEVMMGASNELPQDEALNALYDRFLLRYRMGYIAEDAAFLEMLRGDRLPQLNTTLTLDDVHEAQRQAEAVRVPEPTSEAIAAIRRTLVQQGIQPSDRRYKEALGVLRAKAWLMGRPEVNLDDLSALVHVLWDDPTQKRIVQSVVLEIANPLLKRAEELFDAVQVAWADLRKMPDDTPDDSKKRTMKAIEVLSKVNTSLKPSAGGKANFPDILEQGRLRGADMSAVEDYVRRTESVKHRIQDEYLKLDKED